jgi:cobalamin biosynthesis Mg chelatase CobN
MSEQPLPTPGRENVFDALIADLRAREAQGLATYKRSLETFNGRDPLQDLEEELLDALVYCKQARMERDHPQENAS